MCQSAVPPTPGRCDSTTDPAAPQASATPGGPQWLHPTRQHISRPGRYRRVGEKGASAPTGCGSCLRYPLTAPAVRRPPLRAPALRLRYLNRPTLSRERIELTSDHQVLLTLKKKRRNGVKRILLEPHAFLARLCALIPPPMSNQTIYFGVLAAGSAARPHCIPTPHPSSPTRPTAPERPATMAWAELLQRTFAIDIRQCPCGGRLTLTAVIESPDVFQATAAAIILSNQTPTRMTTGP